MCAATTVISTQSTTVHARVCSGQLNLHLKTEGVSLPLPNQLMTDGAAIRAARMNSRP
jgi:hypothetical protein